MYLTFINGVWSEGNTPIYGAMDHAVWLGSSVFDGARSIAGKTPDLELHLNRLVHSAQALGLDCPYTVAEMVDLCRDGIAKFPADAELYLRPMVFGTDGLLIPNPKTAGFALTLFDAAMPGLQGFSASLSVLKRPDPSMAPTDAKASCLYPNTTKALRLAQQAGFDNAVVCDSQGYVAEFATANLFFVAENGDVVTPKANGTFLSGITRARVLQLLENAGVPVHQRSVRPEELLSAREMFSTGNYGKVMPCIRFDGHTMEVGPIAQQARQLYFAFMNQ
jgi:branched-chain amino acid aminotransferase